MSDKKYCSWEEAVLWLKSQPHQAELVRGSYYDDSLREAAERFFKSAEWTATRQFLPAVCGKALELGAGRGIASYALVQGGWDVTAVEPDPSPVVGAGAIRFLATDTGTRINVIQERAEQLPFVDSSFDLVYGRAVLHHAGDLGRFCAEAARVLKTGGMFIGAREHVISKREDLQTFLDAHPLHRLYGGENAYTLNEYCSALTHHGIRLTHVLSPFESDINLAPWTRDTFQRHVARTLHVLIPFKIPKTVLRLAGRLWSKPGRLYTFIGERAGR